MCRCSLRRLSRSLCCYTALSRLMLIALSGSSLAASAALRPWPTPAVCMCGASRAATAALRPSACLRRSKGAMCGSRRSISSTLSTFARALRLVARRSSKSGEH